MNTVPKNPLAIKWPTDAQGAMQAVRTGGLKSAAAIRGDAAKLAKFKEYLTILGEHAQVRFDADVAQRNAAKESALSARVRVVETQKKAAEAKAAEYEAAAMRVRKAAGIVDTPVVPVKKTTKKAK